jgi:hypothetical protein
MVEDKGSMKQLLSILIPLFAGICMADSFSLNAENDCLEQTDGWYSFGTQVKYKSTDLWGASVALEGYTPENKDSYAPQYGDRPYAGYTHLDLWKNYVVDQNDAYVILSLGVIGPASGAELAQSGFHYLTGMHMPMGWKNQLKNEPAANVGGYESVPVKVKEWLELKPFIGANLGNRLTDAECGSFVRAGWNMPKEFSPVKYNFASYEEDEDGEFYAYAFAGAAGQAIAYDHLLDGSLFQDEIVTVRHKNFVANGFVGAVLGWRNFELKYTHCEMTEQWLSQPDRDNKWDGVEVGYKFKL